MHDLLFRRQTALDDDHLLAYVRELGLDAQRVERELAGHVLARECSRTLKAACEAE